MTDWFARPVLHVKDVAASLRFYEEKLGFTSPWRNIEEGVAQVERQGCAIILANTWPHKAATAVVFVSLSVDPPTYEASATALDALRAEFEAKDAPVKDGWWGYRLIVIDDPDGNQLFFNYPAESTPTRKHT